MTKEDLILERIEEVREGLRANQKAHAVIGEQVTQLRVDVGALKVKAGIWGLIAGALPALGAAIVWLVKGGG